MGQEPADDLSPDEQQIEPDAKGEGGVEVLGRSVRVPVMVGAVRVAVVVPAVVVGVSGLVAVGLTGPGRRRTHRLSGQYLTQLRTDRVALTRRSAPASVRV